MARDRGWSRIEKKETCDEQRAPRGLLPAYLPPSTDEEAVRPTVMAQVKLIVSNIIGRLLSFKLWLAAPQENRVGVLS